MKVFGDFSEAPSYRQLGKQQTERKESEQMAAGRVGLSLRIYVIDSCECLELSDLTNSV